MKLTMECIKKYLYVYLMLSGMLANIAVLVGIIVIVHHYTAQGYSLSELAETSVEKVGSKLPITIHGAEASTHTSLSHYAGIDIKKWEHRFSGSILNRDYSAYDESGRLIPLHSRKEKSMGAPMREISVTDVPSFLAALKKATPGTEIVLEPGRYRIKGKLIHIGHQGNILAPIYVTARHLGSVVIELETLEGFYIDKPYWVMQGLIISGVCKSDTRCEHAFHIVGNGKNAVIRNNVVRNFNAPVKVNGTKVAGKRTYPDNLLIENNSFYNEAVRNTGRPVTLLDILNVNDSVVRGNLIANFAKGGGNNISYAAFFKGGGENNVFERNLVICNANLSLNKGARVGLSFGGGGTGQSSCREGHCAAEQGRGVMRDNIIMHCSDVGIYLNKSGGTQIYNNTLINTLGIDVRFKESSAFIGNNILTGRIKDRNSGSSKRVDNLVVDIDDIDDVFGNALAGDFSLTSPGKIVNKGKDLLSKESSFCGDDRGPESVDMGAIEYNNSTPPCVPLAGLVK